MATAAARFADLHASGCFVIPNPWDVGTARFLASEGFVALATTSAGFAFSRGLPDETDAVPPELMLDHIREIVGATDLPVNADFQNGYAAEAELLERNVGECVATGVAGLSIEDASGDPERPLFETSRAVERVRAARRAIDASGSRVVLTARCEAYLLGVPDPLRSVLDRLVAYADAGADCLYAPGVTHPDEIAAILAAVAPRPVNVLATSGSTLAQLAGLGVRRVSVGSAFSRVAWGAFMRSARQIRDSGTFESFTDAASFGELNGLFSRG